MERFSFKYSFLFVVLIVLFSGCRAKKHHNYYDYIELIYNMDYEPDFRGTYNLVNDETDAKAIACAYFATRFKDLGVDFNEYKSLTATLINREQIWRVKMVRHEDEPGSDNPKYDVANYFVFIARADGAVFLIRRERGEWIGDIEFHERAYEMRTGKTLK